MPFSTGSRPIFPRRSSAGSACCASRRSPPSPPMRPTARPRRSGSGPNWPAWGSTRPCTPRPATPSCLASHPGPGGPGPHLMFYGHYDVQPAEPLELWDHPPFEPTLVDGPHGPRVYARGAVDDKGQVMLWLEALRAWHDETGSLPVRVTVLIEGEEEVGSANLEPFIAAHRDAARGRCGGDQRYRHVGHRHPGLDHAPARDGLLAGDAAGCRPRPAFRHLRRLRAQSDQRAHPHHRPIARRPGPGSVGRLLRRHRRAVGRPDRGLGFARLRRERVSRRDRPVASGWRAGPGAAGAAVGAADRRHQRHLGRLSGTRRKDRDRGRGRGQDLVPTGARSGSRADRREFPALRRRACAQGCQGRSRDLQRVARDRDRRWRPVRQSGRKGARQANTAVRRC